MRNLSGAVLGMALALGGAAAAAATGATPAIAQADEQLAGTILFARDSDEITPAAAAALDRIAAAFIASQRKYLFVRGHSDPADGNPVYGRGLSQRRAMNVRSYLAGRGVKDQAMTATAWSTDKPVAKGSSPKNRRVEIVFSDKSDW